MSAPDARVELLADAPEVVERFRRDRLERLVGPEDDMWAHFAENAVPHAIVVDGEVAGCCSIDDERQLHAFHLSDELEALSELAFDRTVELATIAAAVPSTVDPVFLALSSAAGRDARPLSYLYEHVASPTPDETLDMRIAGDDDLAAAVAFDRAQTDSPSSFLEDYLAARIERRELLLWEDEGGVIVASGECRTDTRRSGYAHLGVIVRADRRSLGVGSRVMMTLADVAASRGLVPLCSTDPTNVAAQRAIRNAGFRRRHTVLRVAMARR